MIKVSPMICPAPLVRGLVDGSVSQMRLVISAPTTSGRFVLSFNRGVPEFSFGLDDRKDNGDLRWHRCPWGQPGDLIWVRETTIRVEDHGYTGPVYCASDEGAAILDWGLRPAPDDVCEVEPHEIRLRSAASMLRSHSRLTLRITDIGVQRLQDIDTAGAMAEGCKGDTIGCRAVGPKHQYARHWEESNGEGSWNRNPWVWVLSFEVIKANVATVLSGGAG